MGSRPQLGLDDGVYTPQAVVDGQQGAVCSNIAEIRSAVAAATRTPKVPLLLTPAVRVGDRAEFHLTSVNLQDSGGSDNKSHRIVAAVEEKV